jgi:hypothetical protein
MTGIASVANSQDFNYSAASTANVFSSQEFYDWIVIDNAITTAAITVFATCDGSNPVVGAGTGTLAVPPNTQLVFANLMALPSWNLTPMTTTPQGTQPAGAAPWFVGKSEIIYGTAQQSTNTGRLGITATYTSTFASPAVFTSAAIAALGNGAVVKIGSAGIQTNFAATTTYYVVGVSGNTFQLALTSGGTGVNGNGASTGAGSLFQQRTVCAVTPNGSSTGNIIVTFQ